MKKIDKIQMAKGYMEMGKINLSLVEELFHLDHEGAMIYEYEMGKKKTKGDTERE